MRPNAWQTPGWRITTSNLAAWLADARQQLTGQDPAGDPPGLAAQVLLEHTLGQPRAWVLAHPEAALSAAQIEQLNGQLVRLAAGVPLPYVLGEWEFYGLRFEINPAVLIPRPETELLVETALHWLRRHPARRRAADVGTGSGCIAAALAVHTPNLRVTACDVSRAALTVAQHNFARLGLAGRVQPVQANLLSGIRGPFDLVCANLPYIPSAKLAGLPVARHEPRLALDGGTDGLTLIERLLRSSPRWLAPGGLILLEIEADHGQSAPALAGQVYDSGAEIELVLDLAGLPRLLKIQTLSCGERL